MTSRRVLLTARRFFAGGRYRLDRLEETLADRPAGFAAATAGAASEGSAPRRRHCATSVDASTTGSSGRGMSLKMRLIPFLTVSAPRKRMSSRPSWRRPCDTRWHLGTDRQRYPASPRPDAQVDVFHVGEEIRIEAPYGIQHAAPVDRRGARRTEHLERLSASVGVTVARPDLVGHAPECVAVTDRIDDGPVVEIEDLRGSEADRRVRVHGIHQFRKPGRVNFGIVVQRHDEFAMARRDPQVHGGAETDILSPAPSPAPRESACSSWRRCHPPSRCRPRRSRNPGTSAAAGFRGSRPEWRCRSSSE